MKKLLSLLVCFLLLVQYPMMCFANQIQPEELQRLDQIFLMLDSNNKQQEQQLQKANELLAQSDKQIQISNNQITLLEAQLAKANNSIILANNSSLKAETSLKVYEKEVNSEIKKLKFERDISILGIVAMAFIKR